MIVIAVAVIVPPRPVFFLLFRTQFTEIPVRIAVGLISPAAVINYFIIIPLMIIGVIRIVDSVADAYASRATAKRETGKQAGRDQSGSEQRMLLPHATSIAAKRLRYCSPAGEKKTVPLRAVWQFG